LAPVDAVVNSGVGSDNAESNQIAEDANQLLRESHRNSPLPSTRIDGYKQTKNRQQIIEDGSVTTQKNSHPFLTSNSLWQTRLRHVQVLKNVEKLQVMPVKLQ
jgi:hypothetical protein